MALSTIVKMSSINNLSDARYCAGMGVDIMGFCIDPSRADFLNPLQFREITGWLAGVKTVAEIEDASIEHIKENFHEYKFDYLEVSSKAALDQLTELGKHFIYKVDIESLDNVPLHSDIHYYLIKNKKQDIDSGTLKSIKEFSKKHSALLGFGISKKNVKEFLSKTNIKGIELKGGTEISPGLKDFDEFADILEMLEIE